MESRRRDKLDASYITDLKIVQGSSELGSSTEAESDMDASKLMTRVIHAFEILPKEYVRSCVSFSSLISLILGYSGSFGTFLSW